MAHDNSLASLTEDWIVAQLQAITFGAGKLFAAADVAAWEGTEQDTAKQQMDEVLAGSRNTSARVFYAGDEPTDLEAGYVRTDATYGVYVALRNPRFPGAARRGDGTYPGANAARELVRNALHNGKPNLTANGYYTSRCLYSGCDVIVYKKVGVILEIKLTVHEVPT